MSVRANGAGETHTVRYGREKIPFTLTRRERKTLSITVHPDLSVDVVAPLFAENAEILKRVEKRARWILRQKRQFLSWMPKPRRRQYRGGETHRYLGRQYRLKLIRDEEKSVKLKGGYLEVRTPEASDAGAVEKLVTGWYRERADVRFRQQLEEALPRFRAYGLPAPTLRLRKMPKRWGSCTPDGEILLNPELVKTPSPCVEYVVMHELCHLKHPNHSRAFFQMLDAVLPDWRKRKERLEGVEI